MYLHFQRTLTKTIIIAKFIQLFYVSGTNISIFFVLSNLIIVKTLYNGHYYPHFIEQKQN